MPYDGRKIVETEMSRKDAIKMFEEMRKLFAEKREQEEKEKQQK
ncbi:hypothetical protein RNS32_12275 [Staphylococcus pseudintermedius]|nr:hypothetical protein [Staphylococcus pseudintermedius]ANS89675.1 hypothetical protein A6M57_6795 [Staphylococcus pseudintermedius]MDA3092250.1 hypothetical protein [Staphylococcus pseudintermedius]MDA3100753.1 hypothetical protein [Staphylococcus pseudintermedius]MDE9960985.1 hypothetical protein [Staphylococcus pseudintermedius]MDK3616711.1 hypothetical protein [Staphylococcus pseudintermedius]